LLHRGHIGNCCVRVALVTASARSLPAWTWGPGDVVKVQAKSSWPPTRSVSICGSERYGTTVIRAPVSAMNASKVMCAVVPIPGTPAFSLPGLALA
jgi:hypothetical protein